MFERRFKNTVGDEFSLDAAADRIVDLAMTVAADPPLTREQRDNFRESMQDAVDALVDECRVYYRRRDTLPEIRCMFCGDLMGTERICPARGSDTLPCATR